MTAYEPWVTAASIIINNRHHSTYTVTVCTTHNTITRVLRMESPAYTSNNNSTIATSKL